MVRSVLLFAALALAASCGGSSASALDGEQLFAVHGCVTCHGSAGEGRSLGPPLTDLKARWEREALAAFLLDPPSAIAADPRLRELSQGFPTRMLSYRNMTEAERLRIADFLLASE